MGYPRGAASFSQRGIEVAHNIIWGTAFLNNTDPQHMAGLFKGMSEDQRFLVVASSLLEMKDAIEQLTLEIKLLKE
jgi:hypothetical protein